MDLAVAGALNSAALVTLSIGAIFAAIALVTGFLASRSFRDGLTATYQPAHTAGRDLKILKRLARAAVCFVIAVAAAVMAVIYLGDPDTWLAALDPASAAILAGGG